MNIIINRQKFSVKGGQTYTVNLPKPFNIEGSIISIIHANGNGNVTVTIKNANGIQMSKDFHTMQQVPIIVAYKQVNNIPKSTQYFFVDITPENDLDGEFSFNNGYPTNFVSLFAG